MECVGEWEGEAQAEENQVGVLLRGVLVLVSWLGKMMNKLEGQ